jgi:hypothetical protein
MHFGLAAIEDLPPIEDFERLAGDLGASEAASEETAAVSANAEGEGESSPRADDAASFPEEGLEGEGRWEEDSWTRHGRAARQPGEDGSAGEE